MKRSPGDIRFQPDGRRIWQSHFDLVTVFELTSSEEPFEPSDLDSFLVGTNPDTLRIEKQVRVCPAGHGIAFSADGAQVYVSCYMSDELAIVDIESEDVRRVRLGPQAGEPPLPRYQPYAVAVSPADGRVFVSDTGTGVRGLRVFDPDDDPPVIEELPTEGVAALRGVRGRGRAAPHGDPGARSTSWRSTPTSSASRVTSTSSRSGASSRTSRPSRRTRARCGWSARATT